MSRARLTVECDVRSKADAERLALVEKVASLLLVGMKPFHHVVVDVIPRRRSA